MKSILPLLPATHNEIAAQLGINPRRAAQLLRHLKTYGLAKKSDRLIPNGNIGRGAHKSALWVEVRG